MTPYASYLRIYEPLAAFAGEERARWTAYAASGAAPDQVTGAAAEHAAGLAAVVAVPSSAAPDDDGEHAFVRLVDGRAYVCPWRTRLRSWLALSEFRTALPDVLANAFVPVTVAENAENALEKWLVEHPDLRPHIRMRTWTVPLPWFVLFTPQERELVLGPRGQGGPGSPVAPQRQRRCAYVTTMAHARRRGARALATLRRTLAEGPATDGVEDTCRWLEEFHPHALVELDYGGLVHLMHDEELEADDSPALVAAALRALDDGAAEAAAEAYEEVTERWRAVEAYESVN